LLCKLHVHLLPSVYNVNSSSERYELFDLSKSWHHSTVTPVVEVDRDEQGCCDLCLQVIPVHPYKENFQPSVQTIKGRKDSECHMSVFNDRKQMYSAVKNSLGNRKHLVSIQTGRKQVCTWSSEQLAGYTYAPG
jgi:hypothetical protein